MKNFNVPHYVPILILFSAVFLFFSQTLNFELLSLDDYELILWNESLKSFSLKSVSVWFSTPFLKAYIPLTLVSFAVDNFFWAEKVSGYRITNLILHAFNTSFVYLIFFRLSKGKVISLMSALIFALHPAQIESVLWVSQRKTLLYSFFFLSGFTPMLYMEKKDLVARKEIKIAVGICMLFLLSMLSKPTAAAILFIVPLYFYLDKTKNTNFSIFFLIGFGLIVAFLTLWCFKLFPNIIGDSLSVGFLPLVKHRLFSFFIYCKEIFLPGTSGMYRFSNIFDVESLARFSSVVIFYAAVLMLLIYGIKKDLILVFWVAWFFLWLLPVVNIYIAPYGDRHLYLPIVGVLAMINILFFPRKMVGAFILFLLLVFLIPKAYSRFPVWQNSETFLLDVVKNKKNDYEMMMNLAGYYEDSGRQRDANEIYERLIDANNSNLPYAYLNYYNSLVHSKVRDDKRQSRLEKQFERKYGLGLSEIYRELIQAKKNREDVRAIIDKILAKVKIT